VGLWDRLRALFVSPPAPPVAAPEPSLPVATPASRAAAAVSAHRYREATHELQAAREGEAEAAVLDAIVISLPAEVPAAAGAEWDTLLIAVADVLAARGERRRAAQLLRGARGPAPMVLRADLLCEGLDRAVEPEDLELAFGLLSEVLRIDIDTPGARERWERLRVRLGRAADPTPAPAGATLLASGPSLPYTLVREVARGGAGVVYEARERLGPIERTVALKLAHDRGTAGVVRDAFTHEARMAVRFRGPNVVPILDVDPAGTWIAMPWASGGSLRARLREGRVDPTFLRPLVAALADVHAQGLVHGDLKPANVLFDGRGAPWLSDFALTRPVGAPATPGSAGYVSAERLAGEPYDLRDDVFAIGRILEELHTHEALAAACVGPLEERPRDAGEILGRLRA
jgi:hypothetical protein